MGDAINQVPNIQSTAIDEEEDWDEENVDAGMMPFAIIVLILAIALLAVEIMTKLSAGA